MKLFYMINLKIIILINLKGISSRMTAKEVVDLLTTKVATLQELIREEDKAEGVRDYVATRLGLKVLSVDYTYFYSDPLSVFQSRNAYEKLHKLAYLFFHRIIILFYFICIYTLSFL